MTIGIDLAVALARPTDGPRDELIRLVIERDAVIVALRLAASLRRVGGSGAESLAAGFERWSDQSATSMPSLSWSEAVGRVRASLVSGNSTALIDHAAILATHLQAQSPFGDWNAEFSTSRDLRWGDFVLEAVTGIEVREVGAACHLRVRGSSEDHEFVRESGTASGGSEWRYRPRVRIGGAAVELLLGETGFGGHAADRDGCAHQSVIIEQLQLAADLSDRYVSQYGDWVGGVVSSIVPLERSPNLSKSASEVHRPGTIGVSFESDSFTTLELLVHEASHQRFFILERAREVKRPDDSQRYYSPLPDAMRTIDRVILAYHACVNIVRCYEDLEQNGAPIRWRGTEKQRRFMRRVSLMEETLEHDCHLSDVGLAFVHELRRFSRERSS